MPAMVQRLATAGILSSGKDQAMATSMPIGEVFGVGTASGASTPSDTRSSPALAAPSGRSS